MRGSRRVLSAVLAALALAGWACAGSVLRTRLNDPVFCAAVKQTADGLGPVDAAGRFPANAEKVVLHVSLLDVGDPHTLRVRWSDPFGRLYLDTGLIPVNTAGGYAGRLDFASTLPVAGAGASLLLGRWTAEVLYDERPVWEGSFRLEEN